MDAGVAAFISLSLTSLKEKRKTEKEKGQNRGIGVPRVHAVLPRVSRPAYFLGHELEGLPRVDSWQIVAKNSFKINALHTKTARAINPRVALRVVTFRDEASL